MKRMITIYQYVLFFSAVTLISRPIFPCSVCVGGFSQEKIDAYLYTGVTLTSLPFLILGLFYFLFRYYKKKNMENN